jgi:hypothetical protein
MEVVQILTPGATGPDIRPMISRGVVCGDPTFPWGRTIVRPRFVGQGGRVEVKGDFVLMRSPGRDRWFSLYKSFGWAIGAFPRDQIQSSL